MAAAPNDLLTLTASQTAVIVRARAAIDAELRLKRKELFPIKIRRGIIEFVFNENSQVLDAILEEYRTAGWEIITHYSSDQGDWFSFYPAQ